MRPEPKNEDECCAFLQELLPAHKLLCLRGAVKDYLRGLNDNDFDPLPWSWVVGQAQSVFSAAAVEQGGEVSTKETAWSEERGQRGDATIEAAGSLQSRLTDVLTDADWEKMKAICVRCAEDAEQRGEVASFRSAVLRHGLLTEQAALRMLESRGLALVPEKELVQQGISLASGSEVLDQHLQPDGKTLMEIVFHDTLQAPAPKTLMAPLHHTMFAPKSGTLNRSIKTPFIKGSVLQRLETLALKIAKDYRWNPNDACRFLLTGAAPIHLDIDCSLLNIAVSSHPWPSGLYCPPVSGLIQINVPSWFTSKQVADIFGTFGLTVREPSLGSLPKQRGRAGRPPDAKSVRLFSFVEKRREARKLSIHPEKWAAAQKAEAMRDWNESRAADQSEDKYSSVKRFIADYKRSTLHRTQLTGWGQEPKEEYERLWAETPASGFGRNHCYQSETRLPIIKPAGADGKSKK